MLQAHFNDCERMLLATSQIPANSGHSLHKGTPRETFIKQFLEDHLSERVSVGTGEVIDATSKPNEPRNQLDIIIFKREYPKLHFGGGIHAFLIESLVASIEVKSTLTKIDLTAAIKAARSIKAMKTHERGLVFSAGHQPPGPLCFVVAYDGPKNMATVHGWIREIIAELSITMPVMPLTGDERTKVLCPIIDGIFVLGRGFIYFDNVPNGFINDEHRQKRPSTKWSIADTTGGALLFLFLQLTTAVSTVSATLMNPIAYLRGFRLEEDQFLLGD